MTGPARNDLHPVQNPGISWIPPATSHHPSFSPRSRKMNHAPWRTPSFCVVGSPVRRPRCRPPPAAGMSVGRRGPKSPSSSKQLSGRLLDDRRGRAPRRPSEEPQGRTWFFKRRPRNGTAARGRSRLIEDPARPPGPRAGHRHQCHRPRQPDWNSSNQIAERVPPHHAGHDAPPRAKAEKCYIGNGITMAARQSSRQTGSKEIMPNGGQP